jgi:hypothetical protein
MSDEKRQWEIHDGGKLGQWDGSGPTICEKNSDNTCQPLFELCGPADLEKCRENLALGAAAPEMLAMLKELEWLGDADGFIDICPLCGADCEVVRGHHPDCRLSALIAKAEGKNA